MATAREAQDVRAEPRARVIDFGRLMWSEYLGFVGALVLFGSLFLTWWSTSCSSIQGQAGTPAGCNINSKLHGHPGDFTAFQTYRFLGWLLVAACAAPFILGYIIARGHELTWRPGEVTMIVGIVAAALILINGIIFGKPSSNIQISFGPGYLVGLLGAVLISVGGFVRQAMLIRSRKPPGVL